MRDENVKDVATTACRRCRGGYQHSGEHDYRSDYEVGLDDGLQIAAKIAKEIGDGEKNLCENSGGGFGSYALATAAHRCADAILRKKGGQR